MDIEEKVLSANNKNTPVVTGNLWVEKFDVGAHGVCEVSQGNVTQAFRAAKACVIAGLPIEWATQGLVEGHGCPDQKTSLKDVTLNNIDSGKLGDTIRYETGGFDFWVIREPVDLCDHQLGSGEQQESSETGLVKVGSQLEEVTDIASRRVFSMIRVVPKVEQSVSRKIYNFGPLELDKAA